MADIKTHLRELSVATAIGTLKRHITVGENDKYQSRRFFNLASQVIDNDITSAQNILNVPTYTDELREIIDNGFRLGNAIFASNYFNITNNSQILWLGNNTHQTLPIDIKIGPYEFSLKEDSFILTNMGLYNFVNSLTGTNYRQGELHVFRRFALAEFNNWFNYTWNRFKDSLRINPWEIHNERHNISAFIQNRNILMVADNYRSTIPLTINTETQYNQYTNSHTREQVFAKWINEQLRNDTEYLHLKHLCASVAGQNLCNYIRTHINPCNFANFFRIYQTEYYYAKVTSTTLNVFKIPSLSNFNTTIRFEDCISNIPSSQLNVLTSFRNISTNNILIFRNECRYSHGQFNGIPEAKLYLDENSSLTNLYEEII